MQSPINSQREAPASRLFSSKPIVGGVESRTNSVKPQHEGSSLCTNLVTPAANHTFYINSKKPI